MTSFPKLREQGPKAPIQDVLDDPHRSGAVLAIANVLSTARSELTLAQLIDGLPLLSIAMEARGIYVHKNHPLREHLELCEGVLDRTRAWLRAFEVSKLRIEKSVLEQFQATEPNSDQFNLRLIEITAVAIHEISVSLFEDKNKSHDEDEIHRVTMWQTPPTVINSEGRQEVLPHLPPKPILFYHYRYLNHENYPEGLADAAGYWVEDRIFGGVVLFDRGESDMDCRAVYVHPGRRNETVRVWKLLDHQREFLLGFLKAENVSRDSTQVSCPLPLSCERTSTLRVDEWDAMAVEHIYRDPWERKVPEEKNYDTIRYNTFDYP